jgi:hypothetical protein
MSTSTQEQLRQVLTVVTSALSSLSTSHLAAREKEIEREERRRLDELETEQRREAIRHGTWHDGRIDCIAGNGVISELGVGIERFDGDYEDGEKIWSTGEKELEGQRQKLRTQQDIHAVRALPIVVLKNFSLRSKASPTKDEVLEVLAQWAAALVERKVCNYLS